MQSMQESATAQVGYWSGVHHIALQIPPGAESKVREFYGGVLGMTEVQTAQGCQFRCDDLEFDFEVDPSASDPVPRQAHPGTLVPDIDALAARLAERGVAVEWDTRFPGYRRFFARDPLGNRLEFLQAIPVRG